MIRFIKRLYLGGGGGVHPFKRFTPLKVYLFTFTFVLSKSIVAGVSEGGSILECLVNHSVHVTLHKQPGGGKPEINY